MILDKKLSGTFESYFVYKLIDFFGFVSYFTFEKKGILDQGTGALILFQAKPTDLVYENSLSIIQSFGKVVDSLYTKVKKLS